MWHRRCRVHEASAADHGWHRSGARALEGGVLPINGDDFKAALVPW
jgi:hypothetical protein